MGEKSTCKKPNPVLLNELQKKGMYTCTTASWQLEKVMGRTHENAFKWRKSFQLLLVSVCSSRETTVWLEL